MLRFGIKFFIALFFFCTAVEASERVITVNFSTATLTMTDETGRLVIETKVVLPRGNYYPVPVSGVVYRAEMGPVWTPTQNMHRDYPGRYKSRYGPYEQGNAMGHCKLSINFDSDNPIMRLVRIHGNARENDLGHRLSRSCVRIPDSLCSSLVSATNEAKTQVYFVK